MAEFHCGEGLCKKRVEEELTAAQSWPLRCRHCRVSLYPRDVIDEIPINKLAPNRTVLMKKVGGRLVEAKSSDLGGILDTLSVGTPGGPEGSGPVPLAALVGGALIVGLGVAVALYALFA